MKYHWNAIEIPLKNHWFTINLPLKYHLNAIKIPLEYHWSTTEIPLKYHWNTIDLPLIYHWNTIEIPLQKGAGEGKLKTPPSTTNKPKNKTLNNNNKTLNNNNDILNNNNKILNSNKPQKKEEGKLSKAIAKKEKEMRDLREENKKMKEEVTKLKSKLKTTQSKARWKRTLHNTLHKGLRTLVLDEQPLIQTSQSLLFSMNVNLLFFQNQIGKLFIDCSSLSKCDQMLGAKKTSKKCNLCLILSQNKTTHLWPRLLPRCKLTPWQWPRWQLPSLQCCAE